MEMHLFSASSLLNVVYRAHNVKMSTNDILIFIRRINAVFKGFSSKVIIIFFSNLVFMNNCMLLLS